MLTKEEVARKMSGFECPNYLHENCYIPIYEQCLKAIELLEEVEDLKEEVYTFICASKAVDAENQQLKGEIDTLVYASNALYGENQQLKAKLAEIEAKCNEPIMVTSDVFGGGVASGHNILKQAVLSIIYRNNAVTGVF